MAQPHDRPAANPGGMECEECGAIFVGAEWHSRCAVCEGRAKPMPAAPDVTKKTDAELIAEGVICCDKATKGGTLVSFNPFNAVVQCHACGAVYRPREDVDELLERATGALEEIVLRTAPYEGDPEWPLISGVNAVARAALIRKRTGVDLEKERHRKRQDYRP